MSEFATIYSHLATFRYNLQITVVQQYIHVQVCISQINIWTEVLQRTPMSILLEFKHKIAMLFQRISHFSPYSNKRIIKKTKYIILKYLHWALHLELQIMFYPKPTYHA